MINVNVKTCVIGFICYNKVMGDNRAPRTESTRLTLKQLALEVEVNISMSYNSV